MWISNKAYNELINKVENYKCLEERVYNEYIRCEKELEITRKMLWNLQTECDEKDIYRKLGKKSQMCNALKIKNKELEKELEGTRELVKSQQREIEEYRKTLKNVSKYNESELLKQELKEAYETISQLEKERKDIEKENKQLREKNNKQAETIVRQMNKSEKPVNDVRMDSIFLSF